MPLVSWAGDWYAPPPLVRKRRTLLDTLILLDTYARRHAPEYEGSDIESTVSSMIAKAQSRVRNNTKKLMPLKNQMLFQPVVRPEVSDD